MCDCGITINNQYVPGNTKILEDCQYRIDTDLLCALGDEGANPDLCSNSERYLKNCSALKYVGEN